MPERECTWIEVTDEMERVLLRLSVDASGWALGSAFVADVWFTWDTLDRISRWLRRSQRLEFASFQAAASVLVLGQMPFGPFLAFEGADGRWAAYMRQDDLDAVIGAAALARARFEGGDPAG